MHLRCMHSVHAGVPAPPVRHRRDSRPAPALAAQCTFPRSPDAHRARGDSRRHLRFVEERVDGALPFPNDDTRMTALLLALQTPPARQGGSTFIVIQFVLILGIIYFLMIRPQQK